MSAPQLPLDAHGNPLCRHRSPGRCTWWCSYRRAVVCIGPVAALFIAGCALTYLWGTPNAQDRVLEAFGGVSLVLAIGVPVVLISDRRT
ncbi:hypothetical protein [Saccharothrix longispora]|uniref:hypothetical protein n=1 Tax=Saccharothrix longispora TaxID=33920 RepID=UPI0028FD0F30|nr:hypothetical protein [Saccharothrix longispora]MDU0289554.1 hypothetical protein [Saccharothrix longispora]